MSYYSQKPGHLSQVQDMEEDAETVANQVRFSAKSLENPELRILHAQIHNLKTQLKLSNQEIVEAFIRTSGDTARMRLVLDPKNRKPVVTWSPLEDMALTEPDTSVEFQVLLQEKGW